MAEPGWYNAAGDPPGSQRYWDGHDWVGEPVFEPLHVHPMVPPSPAAQPQGGYVYAGGVVPATARLSGGVKAVAIIVSVLKALPLALTMLVVGVLAAASRNLDEEFGSLGGGLENVLSAAIVVIFLFLLAGAVLLGLQFVGAIRDRPMMVFIPAFLMALLDSLLAVGTWVGWNESRNATFGSDSPGGALLMTALAAAQIYIAVQAIRANSK